MTALTQQLVPSTVHDQHSARQFQQHSIRLYLKLVVADEEALVAVDDVENEALVGVGQLRAVAIRVAQVQLGAVQPQPQAWHLLVKQ